MYAEQIINQVSEFDFEGAMKELIKWMNELDPDDYDDAVAFSTLEGVIDLLVDNCSF